MSQRIYPKIIKSEELDGRYILATISKGDDENYRYEMKIGKYGMG